MEQQPAHNLDLDALPGEIWSVIFGFMIETKESEPDKDQMIMKKLKTWSESVSKSKTVVTRDTPQHSDAGLDRTTLSSLLKSAEGNVELAVTGSGWLKTAGPIKFAIDSKNAFNK